MGELVTFPRPGGPDASGYLARPDGGARGPGLVVIHEWWGVNDQIRAICDDYARRGYRALAADLYGGKTAADPAEAQRLMNALNFDTAKEIVRGAARFLRAEGGKVGLTGYCMGGLITILGAALDPPEFDAAACYYGLPPEDAYDPAKITLPLLGHFARRDEFFTLDRVQALEARLKELGAPVEFHFYDADHAFCNERRPEVYDADACRAANERTRAFFERHLR